MLKSLVAGNIARYRKAKRLTQEELGKMLGVTYQAVSKWETEQAMPDIVILPQLADILQISVDKLLGYYPPVPTSGRYDALYGNEEYYMGVNPTSECLKVISLIPPNKHMKLLELCCGEGRNAVFFARCGYEVSAMDLIDAGIEKTKRLADIANVNVNAFKADINDYRLDTKYDILFSNGAFHYINPELRDEIITNYRDYTNTDGINAFNVFIEKPFVDKAPDIDEHSSPWLSGQLLLFYHDWLVEDFSEYIEDCTTGSKYAVNQIYARKK